MVEVLGVVNKWGGGGGSPPLGSPPHPTLCPPIPIFHP